jgi:hypothetical protein
MAAGDPGSPARYYSSTAIETALSGAIGAQAQGAANTSFIVGSVSGFPTSYPYTLIVDPDTSKEEVLTVFAGSGTTLSVYRGADSTQGVAHSAGAVVRHGVSGRDFRESENHIAARGFDIDQVILDAANQTHVHGIQTGDGVVVGTLKEQTLTRKTLTTPTINGATISGAVTSSATVTGGTFTSVTITSSTISTSTLTGSFTASSATFVSPTISGSPVITGLSSAGMVDSSATPKIYVDSILGSATSAAISAASAAASATAAATSATSAAASASAAASSASASATSATAAATSATSAAASATAAATSATSAAASATAAATSATSAAASATTAAASVATIAGYATASANSASAAATSATSAAASATAAATSATSADASATASATSATSAAASATAAVTSANSASTSATAAATSAASALTSQTAAATSATSAANSATAAATSATSAAASATAAASSATSAEASWDQFDDRYLGAKSTPPALDNDGNPLATGAIYFYTVDNNMYAWNGTSWTVFTSASAITTITASSPLTGGGSGGTVTVSIQDASTSQKGAVQLTDSVSSTSTTSAATPNSVKQAYDLAATALAGLHFHDPVETASTSNITLSGLSAINGYTPSAGERVLVRSQTNQAENGIYDAAVSTWTRSSDFNTWSEVYTSATYVKQGNFSGESFITTVASTGTIDVTPITWALFSTDAVYSAGTGLTLTGTTFALDTTTQYVVPSQSGQAGKYLTTNGTTASWATVSGGATVEQLEEVEQQVIMGALL